MNVKPQNVTNFVIGWVYTDARKPERFERGKRMMHCKGKLSERAGRKARGLNEGEGPSQVSPAARTSFFKKEIEKWQERNYKSCWLHGWHSA